MVKIFCEYCVFPLIFPRNKNQREVPNLGNVGFPESKSPNIVDPINKNDKLHFSLPFFRKLQLNI